MKIRAAFLLCLLITSCAKPVTDSPVADKKELRAEASLQRDLAFDKSWEYIKRIFRVGYPIFNSAQDLCEDGQIASLGFLPLNKYDFERDLRAASGRRLGTKEDLIVAYVIPGSPEDKAGIKAGSIIKSYNGKFIPKGKTASDELKKHMHNTAKPGEYDIELETDGKTKTYTINANIQCDYDWGLMPDDAVNAFADGENIFITKGMMRFIETDQQLALVIAHELGHNLMKHIDKEKQNRLMGTLVDAVAAHYGMDTGGGFGYAAHMAYSQEFEAEADYVGMYLLARAGYELEGAANFWRLMAAEHPQGIKKSMESTHPATPKRFIALEKTVAEIKEKQKNKEPLKPNIAKK